MWSTFRSIAFYLQRKLPFRKKHLASIGYLHPQKIALSKQSDIELIAKKLFVSDDNILKVTDEWKLLSMDQSRQSLSYKRVDHFWREVFSQTASNDTRKYPTVTGVLRWLWEGLGFQKKKIIRKLTWCKQQKKEDIQRIKLQWAKNYDFFFCISVNYENNILYICNSISIFSL